MSDPASAVPHKVSGSSSMSGVRYILAGTALALIMAASTGAASAQETPLPAVSAAAEAAGTLPSEPVTTGTVPSVTPVPEAAAPSATEQPAVAPTPAPPPDPLASLDPADRPIPEKVP